MMEDIHDIRPPVMAGLDPALVATALYVCAGLLLVGLVVLAVRHFRRRRRPEPRVTTPVQPCPYDAALKSLDRLAAGPVHDTKAFYFELGRTVKAYVGATHGFNCLELTTQELGRRIKEIPAIPGALKSEIIRFQDVCDPFRYAPLAPDPARIQKDLTRGRALVEAVETAVKAAGNMAEEKRT